MCLTPTNPVPEDSVLTIEFPLDQVLVSSSTAQEFSSGLANLVVL